jgi:hypothetical protein
LAVSDLHGSNLDGEKGVTFCGDTVQPVNRSPMLVAEYRERPRTQNARVEVGRIGKYLPEVPVVGLIKLVLDYDDYDPFRSLGRPGRHRTGPTGLLRPGRAQVLEVQAFR